MQSPFSFPKTHSLRFALNPHIACVDKWKRLEAIQALGEFLRGHATALRQWIAGHRLVAFPFGTYWMAIFHRARCAPTRVRSSRPVVPRFMGRDQRPGRNVP